jgi:hypothetical protein
MDSEPGAIVCPTPLTVGVEGRTEDRSRRGVALAKLAAEFVVTKLIPFKS